MGIKADLLILDGRHLLYRTSDAFRDLFVEIEGVEIPTGGMYGFLNVATKIHARYGGKVVVAWEGKNNFRLDLYPQYKNKHKALDDDKLEFIREMAAQEMWLRKILRAAGVRQYSGQRCEADDVIGRLAYEVGVKRGNKVIIYSGDSDLRQLVVKDRVWTVSPGHGRQREKMYGPDEVMEKDGVPPSLISDMKALSGDSSDNIPGVRGIGPKTAVTLLNHYGSLITVRAAALVTEADGAEVDWPVAERFKKAINDCKDLEMFHELTRITPHRDMFSEWTEPSRQADVVELLKLFRFRSFMAPQELRQLMRMGK